MPEHITTFTKEYYDFIEEREGFRAKPYLDGNRVPTIGIGTIRYPNGVRVTMKDPTISHELALSYCIFDSRPLELQIDALTRDDITQSQFNAIGSLAYNIGITALKKSTVLGLINKKADPKLIKLWWMKWNKDQDPKTGRLVVVPGLTSRRLKEFNLYNQGS